MCASLSQGAPDRIRLTGDAEAIAFLVDEARALLSRASGRVMLGLAGGPGVGKSTIAAAVTTRLNANDDGLAVVVPMDGFHMRQAKLDRLSLAKLKGSPQTFEPAAFAALLGKLKTATTSIGVPGYSRKIEDVVENAVVVPAEAQILVVEGNYLLLDKPGWSKIRRRLDRTALVMIDRNVARERLTSRRGEEGLFSPESTAWHVANVDLVNFDLVYRDSVAPDVLIEIDTHR